MIGKVNLTEIIVLVPVILAGIIDFKTMKIPNYITFPFIIIAFFYNAFSGDFKLALLGFVVSFILGNVFFIIGGMGGGDVKLMIGIAIMLGYKEFFNILFIASIIGVLWGLSLIIRKYFKERTFNIKNLHYDIFFIKDFFKSSLFKRNKNDRVIIPFGTCLAIGTIIHYF